MNPRLVRAIFTIPMVLLPMVVLVPLPRAAAVSGGGFFVESTEDGIDSNLGDGVCATALGQCTLRAAVMETNALPTADRIELGPQVYGLSIPGLFEEQATTGDLDIYGTLTIVGQGMTLTGVDAGGTGMGDRAIHVHPGATFRLEGVDVVNADIGMGSNGAGLRNDSGNVVIQGSSFQFNRAHNGAGLMNVGQMVIRNSLIGSNTATDSGAGVRNDGTLEIDSSSILENDALAGPGAGIQNHGTLVIRNSTISNNRAGPVGGAIYNGYGPTSSGASLTINNSTIFGNLALTGGSTEPTTGGIYNVDASSVQLSNSILAWNGVDDSTHVTYVDCLGTITSRGYNLFSAVDACTLDGDLTGNILTADPGLGPREEDPAHTASFPLLPGSPALEAGSPLAPGSSDAACDPVDQRGILRPQVARCDIGAREMEGTPPPSPTPPPSGLFLDGFETGNLSAWSSAQIDQGDLAVSLGAALGGAYGLQAAIDDDRALYVVDTTPANESAYAARFYFDPNGIAMASGNAHLLFKALDAASRTVYQIELRSYQGDYQIRAQALGDSGGATNTSWFRLSDDLHLLEVVWRAASGDVAPDGWLALWLDGDLVASSDGLDNDALRVDSVRLGAVAGIDSGTSGIYYFDSFGSTQGIPLGPDPGITLPSPPPTPDAVFADGFESGDLTSWSAVKNEADLTVGSSAALGGGFGLAAIVDDTAPRYVSDWSPVSLKSYAARFYFDPNSILMTSGNSHVLFRALDFAAKTAFQIELRSYQGEYQIRGYAPWDSGGAYSTPWFRIYDDVHLIEAIWQASSAEGAMDGALALWLDGELAASGSGIDNDTRRVDKVDLGAVTGLDSGTSGTYYFDAFASTSGNPLGPDLGITLPSPPATPEQIFGDGFESGDLSAWSAVTNRTDLTVSSSAALGGGF
ncbi:MAG: right-handed parallel beta-helix repeat-containing protein, partial [Anaerolineales bacterium]|nr:right-handed parallel beta-helix repeat-containing protein [Anaerolineales bacterium]